MFGIVTLVIGLIAVFVIWSIVGLFRTWTPPTSRPEPRPLEPPPLEPAATAKTKARTAAEIASCLNSLPRLTVTHVCDGDTLYVAKGWGETKIRLDSIDCPEDGQPWGNIALAGLIKLVGGRTVAIEEHGLDIHGRTLATIYVWHAQKNEWQNVNERMVMLGHAWVMRLYYDHLPNDRQTKLNRLEAWAKSKRVGLWKTDNPIPPWQWRKQRQGAQG